jgi:hypothetical protein
MSIENALIRFINNSIYFRRMMDEYMEIRKYLHDEGYTEEQAASMSNPPIELLLLRDKFGNHFHDLKSQINLFFPNEKNWGVYIKKSANKIDELYPLKKNGSEEGND